MYKKCVCIKDITLGDVFLNTAVFKANTVYEYKKYYRERRAIIKLNFFIFILLLYYLNQVPYKNL